MVNVRFSVPHFDIAGQKKRFLHFSVVTELKQACSKKETPRVAATSGAAVRRGYRSRTGVVNKQCFVIFIGYSLRLRYRLRYYFEYVLFITLRCAFALSAGTEKNSLFRF